MRTDRGMTISELSTAAGLSPAFISQAERGLSMPSVRTLGTLAAALGTNIQDLLADRVGQDTAAAAKPTDDATAVDFLVVRKNERTHLTYRGSVTRYELLAPELKSDVEVLWVKAPPGTRNAAHPFRHGGRECAVMLKGRLEFSAAGKVHVLEAGDSLYLGVGVEHRWRVIGEEDWEAIWVIL